jgi:hypothetical protein
MARQTYTKKDMGTEHFNNHIEGRYTASGRKGEHVDDPERIAREERLYGEYEKAVNGGRLPNAKALRAAYELAPGLAIQLKRRRILVLFQDGNFPSPDGYVYGWHKTKGNMRPAMDEKTGKERLTSFGDVLIVRSDLASSPLALAATLRHELAHVTWREAQRNREKPPKAVKLPDGTTIDSEEQWCNYQSGRQLTDLGFTPDLYGNIHQGDPRWGKWKEFDGVLRHKTRLFLHTTTAQGRVYVRAYTRSDGTQVDGHFRSRPTR